MIDIYLRGRGGGMVTHKENKMKCWTVIPTQAFLFLCVPYGERVEVVTDGVTLPGTY